MATAGKTDVDRTPMEDGYPAPYDGLSPPPGWSKIPDHSDLPDRDGKIVENLSEFPQANLLSDSFQPILRRLHPEWDFVVGSNNGIYWDFVEEAPLRGVISPDWFYVPNVVIPPAEKRRLGSYVMWRHRVPPLIVVEFVSGNWKKELNRTPGRGKFWVYEKRVLAKYYAIWEDITGRLEFYERIDGSYRKSEPNEHGRYPIPEMHVELGLHRATIMQMTYDWMRWWDERGDMLLTGHELAEVADRKAEAERQKATAQRRKAKAEAERADAAVSRAEAMAAKLRSLGIDPGEVMGSS